MIPFSLMKEQAPAPVEYQFRHKTHISMDEYKGVGSNFMELSDRVADGFMRVSDMRADIAIVKKSEERALDYEEIGNVRVGKFLRLPRMGEFKGDKTVQVKKEGDVWLVAVDDQELSRNVTRSMDGTKKFQDVFTTAFQKEVERGMKDCLKKEKLLNSGNYNFILFSGYWLSAINNSALAGGAIYELLNRNMDLQEALKYLAVTAATDSVLNLMNWIFIGIEKSEELIFKRGTHSSEVNRISFLSPLDFMSKKLNWNDPFVRHSFDLIMPPVPVDRLIRGNAYLFEHGDKLIKRS